ncbi:unnamed protein product [Adineta steineri]|uniref:EGF-like domain-containing protein n=1 Tax=Adineta steineri TaxID=433720 RepID=A0A818P7B2_9BILA|nr:unnamed protein product [Adineta steineri]
MYKYIYISDAFHDNAEECCEIGRMQAESTQTCSMTRQIWASKNTKHISLHCRFLTHICCLSNLRNFFCEEGLKTALRLLPCNEKILESKDSYQICCKCCELGVRTGRDQGDCKPMTVLDKKCSEQFTNCCKRAKFLNCDAGFKMGDDERCQDINECLSSPCPKTMMCKNTPGSFQCIEGCEFGYIWSMKYGQCRDIDECAILKHNCTHGHRCENMPGSFRCIRERNCGTGYQVDPVTQTCMLMNVNRILMNAGKPGYICKNVPGTYKCVPENCRFGEKFNAFYGRCEKIQCRSGFNITLTGKCIDINECAQKPSPCKLSERCDNIPGSYRCVQTFTCSEGLEMKDLQCLDIDECAIGNHTCLPPAICKNTYGSFHCECPTGFIFKYDTCVDDDECSKGSSICPINAECRNTPGSYVCDCTSGYKMVNERGICEDINECELSPNICEQKCINIQGSYYCLCKEGYRLNSDKQTCRDLDECSMISNLCQYRCINIPGSYKCVCPSGFTIERGGHCQDIDECHLGIHNCPVNNICVNLQGAFRCHPTNCPKGYEKFGNNRCQLNARWCQKHQNDTNLRCTVHKPVKYIYSFISLPARMNIPTEIFRIRNRKLSKNQHAEFDLRLINMNDPYNNSSQIILDKFQLKINPSYNVHLIVTQELNPIQEIELHIYMKIFTNNILHSISVMKLFIDINQYDFNP